MPSTRTIQSTLNWLASYIEQQPTSINGLEPALTAANLVLQTLLSPPFAWPFNRAYVNFVASGQDTTVAGLSNFGFIEGGNATKQSGGNPDPLEVRLLLEGDASQGSRPRFVCEFINDDAGNITFRIVPAVNENYVVNLITQNKPPLLQSLGYTWAPFPDEKAYIPEWGLLALMELIGGGSRWQVYNQKFVTALLAAQGGLSDLQKNIFLARWTSVQAQLQGTQLSTTERFKAREV